MTEHGTATDCRFQSAIRNQKPAIEIGRRAFVGRISAAAVAAAIPGGLIAADATPERSFRFRYILGSCMYGTTPLPEILPEVRKIGAAHLDVWPRVHGDQREQIEEMGHQKFAGHLESSGVKLGMITQYKLGPFGLKPEMPIARKFGASILISGAHGPKNLEGSELKAAVQSFLERMRPHIDAAERHGLVIGIENHAGSLLSSPDSIRWFGELAPSRNIGVALAPYHLPEDPELVASLVRDLGQNLVHFYAWQHGKGCSKKLPKAEELEQMPGRGRMDFKPIVRALGDVNYKGWTEIFMHPVPRGIPILEKTSEVTAEINRARAYLDGLIAKI